MEAGEKIVMEAVVSEGQKSKGREEELIVRFAKKEVSLNLDKTAMFCETVHEKNEVYIPI